MTLLDKSLQLTDVQKAFSAGSASAQAAFQSSVSGYVGAAGEMRAQGGDVEGIVVLIGGQSNAEGNGPAHYGAPETPVRNVFALKKSGVFGVASEPLHSREAWDLPNYPAGLAPADTGDACHSAGLRLGKEIAAATGAQVTLLPCALGSTSMSMWAPPTTPGDRTTLFGAAEYRINTVRPVAKKPDLIFWAGHESDAGNALISDLSGGESNTAYRTLWTAHINALRAKWPGVPIIYCQLGQYNDASNYFKHVHAGEVQRRMETGYGTNVVTWRKSFVPTKSIYATYTAVSGGNTAGPAPDNDLAREGNKYRVVCTGTGNPQVYLAKLKVGGRYRAVITAYSAGAGIRIANDSTVIAQNQTFVSGEVKTYDFTAATVGLGVYPLNTVTDFTFEIDILEAYQYGDFADCYMIVTHDLPLSDNIHYNMDAQKEIGRRVGLTYREMIMGQPVNSRGPRPVSAAKTSATTVKVTFSRAIAENLNNYGDGTTTLFRVTANGTGQTITTVVRDPGDTKSLIITVSAAMPAGTVTVSYGNRRGETVSDAYRRGVVVDLVDGLPAPMFVGLVAA